jgi:hypothetical protein
VLRCSQVAFYSDGILGGDMIEWVGPNAPVWRRKKKNVEIKEILIPLKKKGLMGGTRTDSPCPC